MISWIQHHLIRHGRWIFLSLLAVVIVAFVFTIGNTPGCTTGQSVYQAQEFYGYDLNSPRDTELLGRKVQASVLLNSGRPLQNAEQAQNEILRRIALLHLAEELNVPIPGEKALAAYIQEQPIFAGPDGGFSRDAYVEFVDGIESDPSIPEGLILAVLEEDYRIQMVEEALAGPGYLLPGEARAQALSQQTSYTLGTARLSFADFDPEIEPTEEALESYFEENQLRYEIPERIEAAYVRFPSSAYEDAVAEPADKELRGHFIENRERFVEQFEAGKAPTEQLEAEAPEEEEASEAVSFEDVRELVRADWIEKRAARLANEAALDFQIALYEGEIARDSAAFNQLLNERGLDLVDIEPYTRDGAKQRRLSSRMLSAAFELSDERYYSDPYPIDEGFGILIYEGRIAPTIPEYAAVADEVRADYLAETKRERFNARGEALKADLESKLAEEDGDFVAAAESLGLEAETYGPFTPSDAPRELGFTVQQQARELEEGELSSMLVTGGNGVFVFVIEKEVPELAEGDESFQQARDYLRRYNQMVSSSALLGELVARGLPEEPAAE